MTSPLHHDQVRYLYPSYGAAEFLEIPFRNPYGSEHCFTLSWDDALSHLSVVTSVQEWRALKALHGVTTPAEVIASMPPSTPIIAHSLP